MPLQSVLFTILSVRNILMWEETISCIVDAFLAGGLIYLYRNEIEKINSWFVLGMVVVFAIVYYIIGGNSIMCLLVSVALLLYAIIRRGGYCRANQQSLSAA